MKTRKSNILGKQVMVEGMMAFGKLETGQRTLDFECCEDVASCPNDTKTNRCFAKTTVHSRTVRTRSIISSSHLTRISWICCPRNL